MAETPMPLWEVFLRARNGLAHRHVGSIHAADAEMALQAARDDPDVIASAAMILAVFGEDIDAMMLLVDTEIGHLADPVGHLGAQYRPQFEVFLNRAAA